MSLEPEQSALLNHLTNTSRENPISRKKLEVLTNKKDRRNRKIITQLQAQGYWIVSLRKGYYIGQVEDLKSYKKRERSRAMSILWKLSQFAPEYKSIFEQLELMAVR